MSKAKNAWYGPGGSLVADGEIECITQKIADKYYGKPYFIAESMSKTTAIILAAALNLKFQGDIK